MFRQAVLYFKTWETREPGGLPSFTGGANPPDAMPYGYERKEGLLMNVTYPDLFQFYIIVIALSKLCNQLFTEKRK